MADQLMVRACADCKWFSASWDLDPSECHRPISEVRSIVTGRRPKLTAWAFRERRDGKTFFTGRVRCGYLAQFFEPKDGAA